NIHISSVCNGMPSCAECRVKLVEGENNVLPPSAKELNLIGTGHFIDQRRLSCQLICFGNITVDLTEQVEKAAEGKVSKKFLQRAQKESADDVHAETGIFIEQDNDFKEVAHQNFSDKDSASEKIIGEQDKNFYGDNKAASAEGKTSESSRSDRPKNRNRNNRNRNRNRNKNRNKNRPK
ncbi:MAG: hypothetical protein KDD34_09040, partial [Bdellovibrionales bacterium]|nr:hypothetical protein [Bdellovibrionales bacterium]